MFRMIRTMTKAVHSGDRMLYTCSSTLLVVRHVCLRAGLGYPECSECRHVASLSNSRSDYRMRAMSEHSLLAMPISTTGQASMGLVRPWFGIL